MATTAYSKNFKKGELTPRQLKAAYLLGTGKGHKETAREVNASINTITQWLQLERFRAERDRVLRQYIGDVIPEAVGVFIEQLRNEDGRDKKGWLQQSAAGRLIALADSQREQGAGGVSIIVDGDMPTPGMPEPPGDNDGEAQ